ncbi:TcaA 3rd/4th domain-containing protein [Mammaliicoccus sciuri]|uniref:TcaA NTF2-like domain-containing protein n=1 Tax=Mammaliicoccus sciuri TaxID=1296 RepID=UPI003A8D598C
MGNENQEFEKLEKSEDKQSKLKIVSIIAVVLLLLCIIGIIVYFVLSNNTKAQLDNFEESVQSKDYEEVSKTLTSKNVKVTHAEAKQFVDYMAKKDNRNKFKKEMNNIKSNIKNSDSNTVDFGYITDKQERKLIEITMNGNKFIFIDRLAFKPIFHDIYIENNSYSNAKYEFNNVEDKQQIITAPKNKTTNIGKFFVGKYDIEAQKIYDDDNSMIKGKVKGNIRFDTDSLNRDKKVIAHASFKDANFKVNLINSEKVDDDIKLYINDKMIEYEKNKVYGAYPVNEPLKVYAKGKISDKVFKTNTVTIKHDQGAEPQNISLKFNEDTIKDYLKSIKDIELGAKSFMEDYTKDLNKAYKESDYKFIDKYIESNSDLSQYMRSMVESKKKNQYRRPEFESVNYQDGKVNVILEKENQNEDRIKSRYTLHYNKSNKSFSIYHYEDI